MSTATATVTLPTETPTVAVTRCAGCDAVLTDDDLNYGGTCVDGIRDERPVFGDCCFTAHLNGCGACLDDMRSHG